MAWVEAYLRTKWHLDASNRLATIDMGRNFGQCPLGTGDGFASNTMLPGPMPSYHRTKWHFDASSRLATTNMGRQLEGCAPFSGEGGELGTHLAQCGLGRGLRPY